MSNAQVKIRTLPRPARKAKPETAFLPWPLLAFAAAAILLGVYVVIQPHTRRTSKTELASVQDPDVINVRQKIQDSHFKEGLLRRKSALENLESQQAAKSDVNFAPMEEGRALGVELDVDDTPDRLYRQLNPHERPTNDNLFDDRVTARLANRKWMNEEEREERVQYVRGFIRSAYDRGYQVEIDQNLVVTGVKKINKKVSIDQILDRLDQKGI